MAQWNGPITEKDFKESVANIDDAIKSLDLMIETARDGQKNPRFPHQLSPSSIETLKKKQLEDKEKLVKQYTCKHERTTGLINVGHDSHKDHYENRCLNCGYLLEWDVY